MGYVPEPVLRPLEYLLIEFRILAYTILPVYFLFYSIGGRQAKVDGFLFWIPNFLTV